MKKRIELNVFIDEQDFTVDINDFLEKLKLKCKNISEEEKSRIEYHDCGHDNGTKCRNVVEVL